MITDFFQPASVEEAVSLKEKHAGSLYFGGGTEINYAGSHKQSASVISLEGLGLKNIDQDGNTLVIGSSVTMQELIDTPLVPTVLQEAARCIYSRNVRNMATLGGNIGANRTDSAVISCLIALSADLETAEEGLVSVEEYISGDKDSLILFVRIPQQQGECAVTKISKSAGSPSVINVAVRIDETWDDIHEAVIAVGGVAPRVIRLGSIEEGLTSGKIKDKDDLQKAVSEVVSPESDILGSMSYKKYICGVVVADCVSGCIRR
jgi:putative selenate reductase FAD-binding subunit